MALVPPMGPSTDPLRTSLYPLVGSALPPTSGTPRPWRWPSLIEPGTFAPLCQDWGGMRSLTPPPVAPLSFQVACANEDSETFSIVVPPQLVTRGSEAGYRTCALPSPIPHPDPVSPEAA